jgi:glycosyltransferase involved in cell wall biosynthesis
VRNAAATIEEQLGALERQTYAGAWELVVADNGSDDGTGAILDEWRTRIPQLLVLDASQDPGPSSARNAGARVARGEFIAFCDADDVVVDGWLAALVDAALEFDIVTGIEDATVLNSEVVQSWRAPRAEGVPRGRFLPFAPTCNLGVWSDVFANVGGFREDYRASEDIEWSWRAQLQSYTLGFAPGAVVHYRYRAGAKPIARQAFAAGMSTVLLYRDYREHGLRHAALPEVLRRWLWLILRSPYILTPLRRGLWVRRAAEAAGRITGSVRFRIVAL